tara:strand:- start:2234 stop:2362 length:129 start_codon:yes stop_codon:yes gene_type:complete
VASIFSGALYSFGLSTSNNNKNGKGPPVNCPMLNQQPKKKEE